MCDIDVPYGQFGFVPSRFALGLEHGLPLLTTPRRHRRRYRAPLWR